MSKPAYFYFKLIQTATFATASIIIILTEHLSPKSTKFKGFPPLFLTYVILFFGLSHIIRQKKINNNKTREYARLGNMKTKEKNDVEKVYLDCYFRHRLNHYHSYRAPGPKKHKIQENFPSFFVCHFCHFCLSHIIRIKKSNNNKTREYARLGNMETEERNDVGKVRMMWLYSRVKENHSENQNIYKGGSRNYEKRVLVEQE